MRNLNKIFFAFLIGIAFIIQTSCSDGFEELNTNPASLPKVSPEELFYTAEIQMLTAPHAWHSIYASKFRWLQYGAGIWGYNLTQYDYFSNNIGNTVYTEYNEMGSYITHINYLIDNMEEGKKKTFEHLRNATQILLIAKGIQTSDLFGSLSYSEAWLARKGMVDDVSMNPSFETQEELSSVWDAQLKESIAALKAVENSTSLASMKGHDRAYNGNVTQWIKAANGLRLRLASRLWKRKPDVAKQIASEVLSPTNKNYTFSSSDDSFILWFDVLYTNIHSGDWHSIKDMNVATDAIMDYLNSNEDPRKSVYYRINNLTEENITAYNLQNTNPDNAIPADYGRWMGATASYDNFVGELNRRSLRLNTPEGNISMRPANLPQVRLWKGNDDSGNGGNWAPIMTHADFCFLAAEFVLRENISSDLTAKEWYETGIKSSLNQWDKLGAFCDVFDYKPMTQDQIDVFMAKPAIKWDNSKALEQIYTQMYIDHFKNVDEAYAFWKRTGYPNTKSDIITFEETYINGVLKVAPRKVKFTYPNEGVHNYENLKARLDVMQSDAQFSGIQDEYGRLWWDVK